MRRVERERTRGHLRHRDAAADTRELAGEELIATVEGVDDNDLVGKRERGLERFGQPSLDTRLDDQSIDDDLDRVVAATIELEVFVERTELTIDARLAVAALPQRLQLLLELALPASHDGRHDVDARIGRVEHHEIEDPLERLRRNLAPAVVTVRRPGIGEQQPQIVVDFGDRTDGGSRIRASGLLFDRDGWRQPVDQIDVGLLHLLEELPRVGRQRFDIAPLSFGVDSVEGQRRLA